jgi:MFS family permease
VIGHHRLATLAPVRRLVLLVSAVVLVDTMFFAAITPLLPYYADRLGLSKAAAGALVAAYPAGTLLLSLPAGWLAARIGVRRTVVAGLILMAVASLAFGFAEDAVLLGAARFLQGVGSAATWAGGLAWLVAAAPPDRRAELIGTAFGAAIGGVMLGPVVGALAREIGTGAVFAAVAVFDLALVAAALREPVVKRQAGDPSLGVVEVLRDRQAAIGAGLVALVGLFTGVVEVLVPLRLDALGAGAALIAGTFLFDAAVQAGASRPFGKWIDRRGAAPAILAGLVAGSVLAGVLPWPDAVWLLVVLVVLAGPTVGVLWVPGMTLLSEGTERRGVDQAYAFALVNLTWAASALAGSAAGSAIAEATSDAVPYLALSAIFATTLVLSQRGRALARR